MALREAMAYLAEELEKSYDWYNEQCDDDGDSMARMSEVRNEIQGFLRTAEMALKLTEPEPRGVDFERGVLLVEEARRMRLVREWLMEQERRGWQSDLEDLRRIVDGLSPVAAPVENGEKRC